MNPNTIKLREILETDIDKITELCQDPLMAEMIFQIPNPYTRDDAIKFYQIVSQSKETKNARYFAICFENNPNLIGTITLHFYRDYPYMAMIGYWMGKEFRNQGYMTEALKLVIQVGFEEYKIKRIFCTHRVENMASRRVMLKAGMEYEGTLKSNIYYKGIYYDTPYYSIINQFI